MRISEVLKLARPRIEDRRNRFLCAAIVELRQNSKIGMVDMIKTKEFIDAQLGGGDRTSCLSNWLFEHHAILVFDYSDEKLKNTRLAWIDHMIEYLEAIGD
jgi:hypothetical protein